MLYASMTCEALMWWQLAVVETALTWTTATLALWDLMETLYGQR